VKNGTDCLAKMKIKKGGKSKVKPPGTL